MPVAESKDNPEGKSGSISQVVTPPPAVVGVIGDISVSFSNVIVCGPMMVFGGTSFTVTLTCYR